MSRLRAAVLPSGLSYAGHPSPDDVSDHCWAWEYQQREPCGVGHRAAPTLAHVGSGWNVMGTWWGGRVTPPHSHLPGRRGWLTSSLSPFSVFLLLLTVLLAMMGSNQGIGKSISDIHGQRKKKYYQVNSTDKNLRYKIGKKLKIICKFPKFTSTI